MKKNECLEFLKSLIDHIETTTELPQVDLHDVSADDWQNAKYSDTVLSDILQVIKEKVDAIEDTEQGNQDVSADEQGWWIVGSEQMYSTKRKAQAALRRLRHSI